MIRTRTEQVKLIVTLRSNKCHCSRHHCYQGTTRTYFPGHVLEPNGVQASFFLSIKPTYRTVYIHTPRQIFVQAVQRTHSLCNLIARAVLLLLFWPSAESHLPTACRRPQNTLNMTYHDWFDTPGSRPTVLSSQRCSSALTKFAVVPLSLGRSWPQAHCSSTHQASFILASGLRIPQSITALSIMEFLAVGRAPNVW